MRIKVTAVLISLFIIGCSSHQFLYAQEEAKAEVEEDDTTEAENKPNEDLDKTKKEDESEQSVDEDTKEPEKDAEDEEKEPEQDETPDDEKKDEASTEEKATDDADEDETVDEEVDKADEDEAVEDEAAEAEDGEEKEEEVVEEEPEPTLMDEVIGIDTVDLEEPQGNWLFKRVWWERAEARYEKLRGLVSTILESRVHFFSRRAELDKDTIDPFYIKVGIGQGELQIILADLIAKLEKERENEGALAEADRSLLNTLKEGKATLEQLQKDVQSINVVDVELDTALARLMEQINNVRGYELEAWNAFKEIARVLNDKKAREYYFKIETIQRNVADIQSYIEGSFSQSFDELISKAKEQISRIESAVQELKEKGVEFKRQIEEREPPVQKVEQDEEEEDELPQPKGFVQAYILDPVQAVFSGMFGGFVAVLNWTKDIVMWPINKLFGEGEQPAQEQEEVQEEGRPSAEESVQLEEAEEQPEAEAVPAPQKQEAEQSVELKEDEQKVEKIEKATTQEPAEIEEQPQEQTSVKEAQTPTPETEEEPPQPEQEAEDTSAIEPEESQTEPASEEETTTKAVDESEDEKSEQEAAQT